MPIVKSILRKGSLLDKEQGVVIKSVTSATRVWTAVFSVTTCISSKGEPFMKC